MTDNDSSDDALLKHWLATRSEAAFRTLVGRYAGLVHKAAMRTCGDATLATEASQNTFITLAEKAGTLTSRNSLAGWLHLTAVMQAKNLHRKQLRDSRKIEHFRQQMDPPTPEQAAIDWGRLSPLLDEALSTLPAKDREALLLRFYRSLSIQEVAATLGIAHAAAQKRVNRATERLRRIFERKGVQTSGSLSAVMAAGFRTDAQAAPALIDTLTHKALAACAAGTTASLTTTTLILLMKKKATLAAAALLLTGAITAVYLKEREKPAAAHRVNITTRDPAGRQAAGEAEDSRSAAGRKRQPVENPDLVAKYGENRTSLSRKITRDLIGILERGLKDDENHLATFKNDHDHDSWRSRIRRVMFYDMQSEIDFSDAQLKEIQTIFLDHFTNSQARDKESLECLRKDPSLMMEYLLVSDATARSVGDPAEFAAMQKRIDDSLAGMDRLLWDMGIVTVFPGPLADPGFVSAFRGILEPNQLQAFDTYLEMKRGTFQRPPKAVELDQMNLAVNSIQKTLNAGDKMNEMIHGLMKDHGLPE